MSTDGIVNKDLSHSASFTPPGDSSMTINQTTPASSPLDTLKALALRNIEQLEYVLDQLGGGTADVPETLLEFIDLMRDAQYRALGEHVPVAKHPDWGHLYVLSDEAYTYDDGSSVRGAFETRGVISTHYPRYDGTYEEAHARHLEAVREFHTPPLRALDKQGHDGPQAG